MKISFSGPNPYPYNWKKIINDQHRAQYDGDIPDWLSWLENEWNCKANLGKGKFNKSLDSLEFTDETYPLAVIKYGSPFTAYDEQE